MEVISQTRSLSVWYCVVSDEHVGVAAAELVVEVLDTVLELLLLLSDVVDTASVTVSTVVTVAVPLTWAGAVATLEYKAVLVAVTVTVVPTRHEQAAFATDDGPEIRLDKRSAFLADDEL